MAKLYVWNFRIGHESYDGWHGGANSAGGWSVVFSFKNNTAKTIKYANFWFTPYNAVGDIVQCSIRRKSTDGVRVTGPISPGGSHTGALWENAWYNNSISRVVLSHVYLEYMDGTEERVETSEIIFSTPPGQRPAPTSTGCGCYIATAVYGSYDCPEVWTLRRYRDETLAKTWYGRAFIHTYYAISPTLVKWFGETEWFKNMWRGKLDSMVEKLQENGVESTPYEDKKW